jgi:hypothetical protein
MGAQEWGKKRKKEKTFFFSLPTTGIGGWLTVNKLI